MKKPVISNRVFWAGIVLASAAFIGRNGGQAQPPSAVNEITDVRNLRVRTLTMVDEKGDPAILMGATKSGPILQLGMENSPAQIVVYASNKSGPSIVFHKAGKPSRYLSPDGKSDQSHPPK